MPEVKSTKKNAEKPTEGAARATPAQDALESQLVKFMKKGKTYSSRDIVVGLGRTPGNKEGQPVINVLSRMLEKKLVKKTVEEGQRGSCWTRIA